MRKRLLATTFTLAMAAAPVAVTVAATTAPAAAHVAGGFEQLGPAIYYHL
jgi:hypothetical protein